MKHFDWQAVELETDRLLLKRLTPQIFRELFSDYSKQFIMDFLGLQNEQEWELERKKIVGGYETYDRTIVAFVMVDKNTQQTVGRAGFHNWYKDHSRAELGYALNHDIHKRKGYMSEAVAAILAYGFEIMQLNRIEAYVGPTNEASLRTVKKFGFQQEGYLHEHYVRNGIAEDSVVFALLRTNWKL